MIDDNIIMCLREKNRNRLFRKVGSAVMISIFHLVVSSCFLSENTVNILAWVKSSDSIISTKTLSTHHGIIRQFTKAFFIVIK